MIRALRRLFTFLFFWREEPKPEEKPVLESEPEPAPMPVESRAVRRANKSRLRQLERARRKFDKFVEPQGPKPTPIERTVLSSPVAAMPTPAAAVADDDVDEPLCVDVHHADRKTDVLYEMKEFEGEFNFRDTILDQLERYFVYLDRMQKHSKEAYQFYRQVGATLLPYCRNGDIQWDRKTGKYYEHQKNEYRKIPSLSPWFLATRPSFACIAHGTDPESERREDEERLEKKHSGLLIPRFFYFEKYKKPPPTVEAASGGDVYTMTVWWDREHDRKRKHGSPTEFAIFVDADGSVRALRVLDTKIIRKKEKKGESGKKSGHFRKGGGHFSIPKRAWHMPDFFDDWATQHDTDPQRLLTGLFAQLATEAEMSTHKMAKISVCKDDRYAVFSVDLMKLPYFFSDRDYQLNEKGHRKRILHSVRPHVRKNGTTTGLTFRGSRAFTWAGYDVLITIPRLDHIEFGEFDIGSTADYWIDKHDRKNWLKPGEVGKRFRDLINSGPHIAH